mmetsp:Transcript_33545/g.70868  ORF Transcript_33545/g.70868 Transcript_33545/m.70868 type:complete len:257 (-) Transcript_33545:103-873(-)
MRRSASSPWAASSARKPSRACCDCSSAAALSAAAAARASEARFACFAASDASSAIASRSNFTAAAASRACLASSRSSSSCASAAACAANACSAAWEAACCCRLKRISQSAPKPPMFTVGVHLTRIAREANSSAAIDSPKESAAGLTHTSMVHLELPPTEPSNSCVSLESRYGTCARAPVASARTTLPRANRLPLIAVASLRWAPATPLRLMRSEPARSTRVSNPRVPGVDWVAVFATATRKTACDRDDALFSLVSA